MTPTGQLDAALADPPLVHVDDVSAVAQERFGRSVALRKVAETDRDELWLDQPHVAARSSAVHQRARATADLVRAGQWHELREKSASAMSRVRGRLTP